MKKVVSKAILIMNWYLAIFAENISLAILRLSYNRLQKDEGDEETGYYIKFINT